MYECTMSSGKLLHVVPCLSQIESLSPPEYLQHEVMCIQLCTGADPVLHQHSSLVDISYKYKVSDASH